jgi:hypothetical protein
MNALASDTGGASDTAMGAFALTSNTGGFANTAIGVNALGQNTTGNNNIAVGLDALARNTMGAQNTALGTGAGNTTTAANANTSGSNNTFLGFSSGPASPTQLTNATAGRLADRLDLSEVHCRMAKEAGVLVSIASDAHRTTEFSYLRFGVGQARQRVDAAACDLGIGRDAVIGQAVPGRQRQDLDIPVKEGERRGHARHAAVVAADMEERADAAARD